MPHPKADRDFTEALTLYASNDGQAYRDRDAANAIDRAFRTYQQHQREREREDFALCRTELVADLAKRWR